jgi:hypothetical protein
VTPGEALAQLASFRTNTRSWAIKWLQEGMPTEPYKLEHFTIQERLAPFRKAVSTTPGLAEQVLHALKTEVTMPEATTAVVDQPKPLELTPAQMVEKYLRLRGKLNELRSAFKERIEAIASVMGTIEAKLMQEIDDRKETSIKCEHGTAFTQVETSVTVSEWTQTLDYIVTNQAWDLLEARVAKGAAMATIEETKKPIPGVKVDQRRVLRVRTA